MTERIKNKLKEGKKTSDSKETDPTKVIGDDDDVKEEEEEEYYFGKELHEERKRKMYVHIHVTQLQVLFNNIIYKLTILSVITGMQLKKKSVT